MVSDWTRAPIEDGVDGTGVYASRLRSRRSARGPQSPKVLSLVGSTFGAISNDWGGIYTASRSFFYRACCTSLAELAADVMHDLSREDITQCVSRVETRPLPISAFGIRKMDGALDEKLLRDNLRLHCGNDCY